MATNKTCLRIRIDLEPFQLRASKNLKYVVSNVEEFEIIILFRHISLNYKNELPRLWSLDLHQSSADTSETSSLLEYSSYETFL